MIHISWLRNKNPHRASEKNEKLYFAQKSTVLSHIDENEELFCDRQKQKSVELTAN